jgi:hypothetical protein
VENARKIMNSIKQDIGKLKKKHQRNSEALEALGKLEDAVNNVQRQLND